MAEFVRIAATLATIYVAGALFNYIQQFVMANVTQKTSKSLRTDIDKKINKLPLKYFDTTTKGDILSRVTNDVDTIAQTLGSSVANLVSALVLFVGVVIMMFKTNWILSLVTIFVSLFGFMFMAIILKCSQKYFNKVQTYVGDLNGHIEEAYSNYQVVKSYNAVDNETEKFVCHNKNLYSVGWKAQFLSSMMQPIMAFVGNLSFVLIFAVGVSIALNGGHGVTLGTLTAFIIYAQLFTQPLTTLAQNMTSVQQASAAGKRVFELLDADELDSETEKTAKLTNIKGKVEFKNVKFGYNPETIILIDDVSIKDLTRENVHDLFDMILQDTWLFSGTVKENLIYNKQNISTQQLNEVCNAVGLNHFVQTLPNGYDTMLNDVGSLSEGQKQQLTIARAMIKNSPLLILDEATSNVDTRTEQTIQQAMDKLTNGRTSFIIAHRLSTIRNADLILVLKDGDIVEQGNHKQLLQKNGFYAELYNSQFANLG